MPKSKFNFGELFKDEGMYHSVNDAFLHKGKKSRASLLRTPD